MCRYFFPAIAAASLLTVSASSAYMVAETASNPSPSSVAPANPQSMAPAIPRDAEIERRVEETLAKMTLDQKVGQMLEVVIDVIGSNKDIDGPSKLAGVNFWGWGGSAVPKHKSWKQGDPYTGDPAQDDQGLNSVFSADRSTIEIIRRANR